MEPDFESYTLDELLDAKEHLDRDNYPDRFAKVCNLIESKAKSDAQVNDSEEDLRQLFKKYKDEKFHIWKTLRGTVIMFISFRVMEYFEWSLNQKIGGGVIVLIAYVLLLVVISEFQFSKFKKGFENKT